MGKSLNPMSEEFKFLIVKVASTSASRVEGRQDGSWCSPAVSSFLGEDDERLVFSAVGTRSGGLRCREREARITIG